MLISAHDVDAVSGISESWSAYRWVRGISRHADVTLVALDYKPRVTEEHLPGVEIIRVWRLPLSGRLSRFDGMAKPSFPLLYRTARRIARERWARSQVDLLHSLTPNAVRYPSPFSGLGAPFVHGPCGGSIRAPAGFGLRKWGESWYVRMRSLDRWRFKHDPLLRATIDQASRIVAIGPYVREHFESWPEERAAYMSDTAAETVWDGAAARLWSARPRILFVGRLVPKKGPQLLIEALGQLKALPGWTARIVGDGFLRPWLERRVAELDLQARVEFTGRRSREQVLSEYQQAEIFCVPSLEETSGNAVFEAMGYGLPCVIASGGGPAAVVSASSGIQIRAKSAEEFVPELAGALHGLLSSHERRRELGEGAIAEVQRHHMWEHRIASMLRVYGEAIAEWKSTTSARAACDKDVRESLGRQTASAEPAVCSGCSERR